MFNLLISGRGTVGTVAEQLIAALRIADSIPARNKWVVFPGLGVKYVSFNVWKRTHNNGVIPRVGIT